jgi:hypothetical protein
MADLSTVFTVLGLFMLRIGAPVLVLFGLGILIERWQARHRATAPRDHAPSDGPDLGLLRPGGEEP